MRDSPRQSTSDPVRGPGRNEDSIQRVVRRRIRPELVVLVVGLVFVAGAVAKPWGGRPPARTTATGTAHPIAIASDSASPAPLDFHGIPGLPRAAPYGHGRTWADVSWSVLRSPDSHTTLGISTIGLTLVPYNGPYLPDAPVPKVSWSAALGDQGPAIVRIAPYSYVFAIAATWPKSLQVSAISITYSAPSGSAATAGAPTPVLPVPANTVVLSAPTAVPSISPVPSVSPIRSGQFWVPPSGYSSDLDQGTLALVWQLGPWSWPTGEYEITLAAQSGPVVMRLSLEKGS